MPSQQIRVGEQRNSQLSNQSIASAEFQLSISAIESNKSINELTKYSPPVVGEFQHTVVASVIKGRLWALNAAFAYQDFKAMDERLDQAHRAYLQEKDNQDTDDHDTHDRSANFVAGRRIRLAELAIAWGEAAVSYALSAVEFMKSYNCRGEDSISHDIVQTKKNVSGGRKAVAEAKTYLNNAKRAASGAGAKQGKKGTRFTKCMRGQANS